MKGTGDCFEAAANYVMDHQFSNSNTELKLVHGIVSGQGPLEGLMFPHGWVEHGDIVIEKSNGLDLEIPKGLYYTLGHILEKNIRHYSYKEMAKMMTEHGTYGPWELPDDVIPEGVDFIIIGGF